MPAAGQPDPPRNLRLLDVGEFSANISFDPSPTFGVWAYRVYVSQTNGTTLAELLNRTGEPLLYDTLYVAGSANASSLQTITFDPRFWFRNATTPEWTLGFELPTEPFKKFLPPEVSNVSYLLTGLKAEEEVWIAVTAIGPGGENATVRPVPAVPLAQPPPVKPRNEGILVSWALILAIVLAFVFVLGRLESRRNRKAYLYILPALLGLVALTFYPVLYGFYLSFTDRRGTQAPTENFVGLGNYASVFSTPDFVMVTVTTVVWTVVNVFFHVIIGLFLAVLLNRKIRGRVAYRALLLLPWAVPSYITTLAWRGMFETQRGLINALLGPLGWSLLGCGPQPCNWLGTMPLALFAVILTNVWLGFPFMMMVFSGGLQGISPELYEAADIDGLTPWQKFRHITLPLLKPTIVPASLLGFIWTFNMFNVIYLMTAGEPPIPGMRGGGTDILITFVYTVGLRPPNEHGFAAAYSVVIFFMLLAFGLFYTRYTGALEAFAGRAEPRERRAPSYPGARLVAEVRAFWSRRISGPVRAAASPDQPAHIAVSGWLVGALGGLGLLEAAYGSLTYRSMRAWFILTAVHGTWFFLVGLGLLAGAAGIALRQRAGRRLAVWCLLLDLAGGLFALLGVPLSPANLRIPAALSLLALLARPVAEYTKEPDPWTRFLDALIGLLPARSNPGHPRREFRWLRAMAVHAVLIGFTLFAVMPVVVVAGTSFGRFPAMGLQNVPILRDLLLPGESLPGWTLEHLEFIVLGTSGQADLLNLWFGNALAISAGTVLVAFTVGYALSLPRRGPGLWVALVISTASIPVVAFVFLLAPFDWRPALTAVAYIAIGVPFLIWVAATLTQKARGDLMDGTASAAGTGGRAGWRRWMPVARLATAIAFLFILLTALNFLLFGDPCQASRFFCWLQNSLIVSAATTAVGLLLALTGGYAFSRFQFRGKRGSMLSFVVVQMFPGVIILIPYYVLFFQLGLINTHFGLVISYSVTALPFVVWFLKGFFDTIPGDLEEAAMVDGATRLGAFWRVIVPIAKPAIAVAALFVFLTAWNEWLLAFTFMTSSDNYTLPVGISSFINPPQVDWNRFAAISLLVSLPVVILFIAFQRYLVSGLTKGAVKG